MANNIGTLVGAAIRPFAPESVFASAFADEIQGGLHVVQTDASRNIMPSWLLEDGMVVVVLNSTEAGGNRATYQYNGVADPSWEVFGASSDASIADLYSYIDGSLGERDLSINYLDQQIAQLDASIVRIDVSLNDTIDALTLFPTITYVDNSLGERDLSINELYTLVGDVSGAYLPLTGGNLTGDLAVDTNVDIGGNLTINGSLYVVGVEEIDVSTGYINMNTGMTGSPPSTMQAGIIVARGSEDPYAIIYDETYEQFRIGQTTWNGTQYEDASTQAVATREDNPLNQGIPFWNDALARFDTSAGFTITNISEQIAQLDASIVRIDGSLAMIWIKFGSIDSSIDNIWTKFGYVDTSLNAIWTKFGSIDSSIDNIWTKFVSVDSSIDNIWIKFGYVDTSLSTLNGLINTNITDITQLDASIVRIDASLNDVIDIVSLGFITESSIGSGLEWNAGYLDVSIASVTNLSALTDVSIGTLATNDFLRYDGSVSKWVNVSGLEASLAYWPLSTALLKEASIGSGFTWNAGLLDVSVSAGVLIDGSSYVMPMFNPAGNNIINSYFKSTTANEFTVANDSGDLKIYSGLTNGNLHIKTINNGSADMYIDPRNGVVNFGRDYTGTTMTLQAWGTQSNIDLILAPLGTGKTKLHGQLEFTNIIEVSTNKVLYFDSSLNYVTYGNAPEGVTSLSALTDVSISSITDQNLLQYDTASSKWINVGPLDASAYFQTKVVYNSIPGSATTGTAGDVVYDASYLYVCTSANTWGRVLLDYAF